MTQPWARSTAALGGAALLVAVVVGPVAADEVEDQAAEAAQDAAEQAAEDAEDAAEQAAEDAEDAAEEKDGDLGIGHAYGRAERPADARGLARGHAKMLARAYGRADRPADARGLARGHLKRAGVAGVEPGAGWTHPGRGLGQAKARANRPADAGRPQGLGPADLPAPADESAVAE